MADNTATPAVTEHQGIDIDNIKGFFKEYKDMNADELSCGVQSIEEDVLELIEHAVDDGLLNRVAQARIDIAKESAEAILPSQQ
jgi:hypothetical protein